VKSSILLCLKCQSPCSWFSFSECTYPPRTNIFDPILYSFDFPHQRLTTYLPLPHQPQPFTQSSQDTSSDCLLYCHAICLIKLLFGASGAPYHPGLPPRGTTTNSVPKLTTFSVPDHLGAKGPSSANAATLAATRQWVME
jgi:hypothetical protein